MNARHLKNMEALVADLEIDLPVIARPELAPLVNWSGVRERPIHRWFRYREGFSPGLVPALGLGEKFLDPYCGSGSIMVGAAQSGLASVGIEVNPLAVFVARTKLTPLSVAELGEARAFSESFRSRVPTASPWPLPGLKISEKVFEPQILDSLLRLRSVIESASSSERVRDFLFLAWLAILEPVGSYFKEGNGIKYRNRKRTKAGYVLREEGAWQRERFGSDQPAFVLETYGRFLNNMLEDANEWQQGDWANQRVLRGDALKMVDLVGEESFSSIVFSPPYANRFDYFESLKVELWFGGFVDSYGAVNELRKQSMRSHLGADLLRASTPVEELENLIDMMDRSSSSWRMRVPAALRGYFEDMYQTLLQCRKLLPPGNRCFVVVGNSAYAGVIIPTDSLIARLGLTAGFTTATRLEVRHLTVAPQQRAALSGLTHYMRESVIVLE